MFNDSSARFWIGREHRTYAFENAVVHQFPAYYVVHTCHLMIPRRLSRFKLFQPGKVLEGNNKKGIPDCRTIRFLFAVSLGQAVVRSESASSLRAVEHSSAAEHRD